MPSNPTVDVARFAPLMSTERQRSFPCDFLATWEQNEFWGELVIGELREAPGRFEVREEDVLAYNLAVGETHPLFVDPEYARGHAPGGTIVVHPIFATTVVFWFSQPGVQGSWIRTPGARNPFQRLEIHEPIRVGDRLRLLQENSERFWRRDKAYVTTHGFIQDQSGTTKVEVWGTLILPTTPDAVRHYAEA